MGNTNSTEGSSNSISSYQQQKKSKSRSNSNNSSRKNSLTSPPHLQSKSGNPTITTTTTATTTLAAPTSASTSTSSTNSSSSTKPQKPQSPIHLTVTEPIVVDTEEEQVISPTITSTNRPSIPMNKQQDTNTTTNAKSGWVSSTGGASPWYGSSHHRASISGPYYRTRGMSVTRDNENDEDLTHILPAHSPTNTTAATTITSTATPTAAAATNATISTNTSHGVPTIITWTQGGNNVYVTGTFNGWKHKIKLVKSTHDFSAVLELPPGTHRLKFIVDDEWKCSNDMETATDPDGNLVNYLQVMDDDDEESNENDLSTVSSSGSIVDETSKKYYSNQIPPELLQLATLLASEDEEQRRSAIEWEKKQPQPPALPPHLDKVLLNSHTVSEEDNSVLHEPNHVTLNHLYACSIKDNVMALATTSRYRKKYVTTMYYRPVSEP